MKEKCFIYIAMIAVSGCTVQPTGNGGYRLSTPSLGSMVNTSTDSVANSSESSAVTPSQSTSNYSGQIDGGTAQAQLSRVGTMQYHLDLGAKGTGPTGQMSGMGGVSGILTEADGNDVYTMTKADDGHPCYLTMKLSGNMMQLNEDFSSGRTGCMIEHGGALSFDGTLYKTAGS